MIIYNLYAEHVCNSGTALWNSREEGKEKRMIVNNMEMDYICAGRGYGDVYSKLLNNGGVEGRDKGE
jgi:hypothetical protein